MPDCISWPINFLYGCHSTQQWSSLYSHSLKFSCCHYIFLLLAVHDVTNECNLPTCTIQMLCADSCNGLTGSCNGLTDNSNGLIDTCNGLIDTCNGLIDNINELINSCNGLIVACLVSTLKDHYQAPGFRQKHSSLLRTPAR